MNRQSLKVRNDVLHVFTGACDGDLKTFRVKRERLFSIADQQMSNLWQSSQKAEDVCPN